MTLTEWLLGGPGPPWLGLARSAVAAESQPLWLGWLACWADVTSCGGDGRWCSGAAAAVDTAEPSGLGAGFDACACMCVCVPGFGKVYYKGDNYGFVGAVRVGVSCIWLFAPFRILSSHNSAYSPACADEGAVGSAQRAPRAQTRTWLRAHNAREGICMDSGQHYSEGVILDQVHEGKTCVIDAACGAADLQSAPFGRGRIHRGPHGAQ